MLIVDATLELVRYLGFVLIVLISFVGFRLLFYYRSFFLHPDRFRRRQAVSDDTLRALPALPFLKVQITTRGSPGSTEVIRRGIRSVIELIAAAPDLYQARISIEVLTDIATEKEELEAIFCSGSVPAEGVVVVVPAEYQTPRGTQLKARSLHYLVELRRQGLNRKPGRTFIVHYDEESVMPPAELRKLIHYLATVGKPLTEGPIFYPLDYYDAAPICRAMEANRALGCYECREVMEAGIPLHMHGSNLVADEELVNEIGWDIGTLDGQPFIAEDFVFGVQAFLRYGPEVFGWHGCAMFEQPPFSLKSAFRQRYRWIIGVLQGVAKLHQMPEFHMLSPHLRRRLVWGTRYRVATFALGLPTGVFSLLYLLYEAWVLLRGMATQPLPAPLMLWLVLVGYMWLNGLLIGAWYNVSTNDQMSPRARWLELARVLCLAPLAGIAESAAGFWATVKWLSGERRVSWVTTPKTTLADQTVDAGPAA